jgi:hypothetical protein
MRQAEVDAHNSGGWITYRIEAGTKEAVEAAIARIERNYHPLGYGTSFDEPRISEETGRWIARGSRSTSCD